MIDKIPNSPVDGVGGKRRWINLALRAVVFFSAVFTVTAAASILFYLLLRGAGKLRWEFLFRSPSPLKGEYGILPGIVNTLYIIILTLLTAAPLGIGAAVYLSEYAKPGRITRLIAFTTGTLAGIPSVVYGLFGAIFFGEVLHLGYSVLTGSLTLSLMVLPIIIRSSQDALEAVPAVLRESALGCGATQWQMLRTVVLPCAKKGLAASVLLAVGRITGESAALLFTAGAASNLPRNWLTHSLASGASLTVQMYLGISNGGYIDEAFGIALVLAGILAALYWLTGALTAERRDRRRDGL